LLNCRSLNRNVELITN